jgi:hypothetical protein
MGMATGMDMDTGMGKKRSTPMGRNINMNMAMTISMNTGMGMSRSALQDMNTNMIMTSARYKL